MKLSKYKPINYVKYCPESITNKCLFCLSYNIKNGLCLDCNNRNSPIYYFERDIALKSHTMIMKFKLSEKQKEASSFFLDCYKRKEDAYLLAVCGSGKTEIMFESILNALNDHKKVLIVIPRKEIVMELYNRLTDVFINTTICILDYAHHNDEGELIISTVNQLLNYEREFDLVIIDEEDAYPYNGSLYLHRLLRKSVKEGGIVFTMSATIKKTHKNTFCMNRRYHKHSLDMPKFIRVKSQYKEFIQSLIEKKPDRKFIIYVPSIKMAIDLKNYLNTLACYSTDENTKNIIDRLKNGSLRYIVSTTILERGITVNNLDVIVLFASSNIFTRETLIQIAGRVGRSYEDPSGSIYFLYDKNKIKFYQVRNYIRRMNK